MQDLNVVPQFLATLLTHPGTIVLGALLILAAVIDWRTYRIPNWLTVGGMVFGLIYNTVAGATALSAFLTALAGLGVGLGVLLPVYMLRVMGAGDVKLMAMVGAFVGVPDILYAVLYSLIAGGVVALGFALYRRAFRRMTANVADIVQSMAFAAIAGVRPTGEIPSRASIGRLPYRMSICVGTIASLASKQLGFA